jgi:phosphocarrier protein HPr
VTIQNRNGLHARPAAEIVKTAAKYTSEIIFIRDDLEVNGKSIMGVMMLAAEYGSQLVVRVDGPDEDAALTALAALIESKFGESH